MKQWQNVGPLDRVLRLVLAAIALPIALRTHGVVSILCWGVFVVGLISGISGWAPPYQLLGISTLKRPRKK